MDNINANLTVDQKFAKLMLILRQLRPFYSAVYEVMGKRESNSVPTVGVTTNELVYNKEFMEKRDFNELIFIMLHEICHISLQHVARREGRDPTLWNIAADLYSNSVLASEFNVEPGKNTGLSSTSIAMPEDCLYCSSINIHEDYTEKIYEELEKQGKENGYFSADGQSGNGQNSKLFEFTYSGSDKDSNSRGYGYNYSRHSEFNITIERQDQRFSDLIDNGDSQESKQQQADKIVSDAVVRVEMSSSSYGNGAGGLYGFVKNMMKSEVDWRKLLRKYLIAATCTDSSFSRPDKRMYYQKQIYPGQVPSDEHEIRGVKVCIDTSGSISDDDIAYFCGQVYQLTKQFKIDAELIYWDTSVESTGQFTGYKEFERVSLIGRGGTDPAVVFNYFDSKQCKIKPVVTLMFTDGWFSVDGITAKQCKKYKDTIWIMTRDCCKEFVAPFGKKANVKYR